MKYLILSKKSDRYTFGVNVFHFNHEDEKSSQVHQLKVKKYFAHLQVFGWVLGLVSARGPWFYTKMDGVATVCFMRIFEARVHRYFLFGYMPIIAFTI